MLTLESNKYCMLILHRISKWLFELVSLSSVHTLELRNDRFNENRCEVILGVSAAGDPGRELAKLVCRDGRFEA